MKLLIAALGFAMFLSCKKDKATDDIQPAGKKTYALNFRISGLDLDVTPFGLGKQGSRISSLEDKVKYITYFAINDSNRVVRQINQTAGVDVAFGTIKDKLPEGHYVIAIAGGNKSKFDILNLGDYNALLQEDPYGDTFFKKFDVTVHDTLNKPVTLKRIVCKVTITFTDKIPAEATYIAVSTTDNLPYDYNIDTDSPSSLTGNQFYFADLKDADKSKPGFVVTFYLYPSNNTGFNIRLGNPSNPYLLEKTIPPINTKVNMQYLLTGPLVTPDSSSFGVTVDSKWGTPVAIPF
ncbi:hypothetical protein GS399_16675 [Pedobacter sp. HMF7647]|uniref:Uncharacterized protein n=1 Tax=Hufsiella arboris TaxID=2695275 RepID=A0A7K1YDY2_9SPHI|nr:hypothetical protein [Hufsiella arboris]MXV52610.1 hypothetical protein [Hufsiella arboris]